MATKQLRQPAIAELQDAPYNPRGITDEGRGGLKFSIKSFGDIGGLTWNQRTGKIVTGHQRIHALLEEHGDELQMVDGALVTPAGDRFPIRTVDWTEAKEKAANVAANNQRLGGFFNDATGALLDEIKDTSPALHGSLLFEELSADLGYAEVDVDETEGPPPLKPENPVTKAGTIWTLGEHRLVCADARLKKNWRKLMAGTDVAQLIFTDPPYGVSYRDRGGKHAAIAGDDLRDDQLAQLVSRTLKWAVSYAADNAAFYIWHSPATRGDFQVALAAAGLDERQYIVWVKETFTLGGADYQHGYEPCFYAGKAGHGPRWEGDRRQSTIWRLAIVDATGAVAYDLADGLKLSTGEGGTLVLRPSAPKAKRIRKVRLEEIGSEILVEVHDPDAGDTWLIKRDPGSTYKHPTQKPVALAAIAVRNNTKTGEVVVDPFAGSGSTLLAADAHERVARCLELDPGYCDVIVERWQDRSGGKATRTS